MNIKKLSLDIFLRAAIPISLVLMLVGCDGGERSNVQPEIVARVNGEPVSRMAFKRMRASPTIQRRSSGEVATRASSPTGLDQLALQRLIQSRLLLQEARKRQLSVSESSVDEAVKSMREKFADLKQFGSWIQAQGLSEPELFASIRDDMLVRRVSELLTREVQVSEKEARQYYETHKSLWKIAGDVRLRMIAVSERKTVDAIVQLLKRGADFAQLARAYSLGQRAAAGGDVGWVDSESLTEPLRGIVVSLKAGQSFGPLQRGDDFLLVHLRDRRPPQIKKYSEVRADVERRALIEKRRVAIDTWLETRQAESVIETYL